MKRLLILFLFPAAAFSQTVSTSDLSQGFMLKAAPLGFGGAFRALADTNAAIHYNPAGLAQRKGAMSMSADYAHIGNTRSHAMGASVVDSKTTDAVSLGLAYDRDNPTIGGIEATVQQATVAAAVDLASMFYFGAAVKGYFTRAGSGLVSSPRGADVDLGFLVKPIPHLSLALTGQNLVRGRTLEEFPLQAAFGAALTLEPHFRFSADVVKNFKTPARQDVNAYFGGELRVAEGMFLRGGFGLDKIRNNNFYTVGAALAGPKLALLFAFAERLNPASETYAANIELYF